MTPERVPFGKYKGKLIQFAVSKDPKYFEWMLTVRQLDEYPENGRKIKKALAQLNRKIPNDRELYTLKPMPVRIPRIHEFWFYDKAGFPLRVVKAEMAAHKFKDNTLYKFKLYNRVGAVFGVRLRDIWYGFAENSDIAGLAFMRVLHSNAGKDIKYDKPI